MSAPLDTCMCADIMAHDESRHFKECPKRGEFPEPAVARSIAAEKRCEELARAARVLRDAVTLVATECSEQRFVTVANKHLALARAILTDERATIKPPAG